MAGIASRFATPSSDVRLTAMLRRERELLWACLLLGVVAHGGLGLVAESTEKAPALRPLTTQFVKRAPRLTKPLELKRRPRPRRRSVERTMVSVQARAGRQESIAAFRASRVLQGLVRPGVAVHRAACFAADVLEPGSAAKMIAADREADYVVDMALEMVDIDALDTGQYQAMVVQDPNDKRNIRGYLRLAIAYPLSVTDRERDKGLGRLVEGLQRLISRLNEWTDIEASVAKRITFDSHELLQTPWVYLRIGHELSPTQGEAENLGQYLLNGGFFFFEGNRLGNQQGEQHLMRFVTLALDSQGCRQGVDWEFEFLPNHHPIFHCYYDFPDGVPIGQVMVRKSLWGQLRSDGVEPFSRGVEIAARLVAFNTNQALGGAWCGWGRTNEIYAGDTYAQYDPTLQFRLGINTIIFALTQEGSITHRLMDSVAW